MKPLAVMKVEPWDFELLIVDWVSLARRIEMASPLSTSLNVEVSMRTRRASIMKKLRIEMRNERTSYPRKHRMI